MGSATGVQELKQVNSDSGVWLSRYIEGSKPRQRRALELRATGTKRVERVDHVTARRGSKVLTSPMTKCA